MVTPKMYDSVSFRLKQYSTNLYRKYVKLLHLSSLEENLPYVAVYCTRHQLRIGGWGSDGAKIAFWQKCQQLDGRLDQPTNGRTDQATNGVTFRVACTQLITSLQVS